MGRPRPSRRSKRRKAQDGRPTTLKTNAKMSADALRALYVQGAFYYQIGRAKGDGRSRVMVCDNRDELKWLTERIKGNPPIYAELALGRKKRD